MNTKTLIIPVVVGTLAFAGATYFYQDGASQQPVSQASASPTPVNTDSPPQASVDVPPPPPAAASEIAPAPQALPETAVAEQPANPPALPKTPIRSQAPVSTPNTTPKISVADKPANKPSSASPVVRRMKVPTLEVPKGQFFFQRMTCVAINNDGTRVIAQNHPFVDIWDTQKATNIRLCPEPYWDISGGAIVAQDASRVHIWNTGAKKSDTYNEKGVRISSLPQIFSGLELKRLGYDFSPRDYVLGGRLYDSSTPASERRPLSPGENGIFQFDPDTGALKILIFMKDIWDVTEIKRLVRLPNGQFLAFYAGARPNRLGLHKIDKDETITKIADIPSKELMAVHDMTSSADGRYVAFLSSKRLEVWDITDKKLILDWRKEFRNARACRFTGDGNLVILHMQTSIKDVATSNLTGGWVNNSSKIDMVKIPSLRAAGQLTLADFELPGEAFGFSPNGKRMVLSDSKQLAVIDVERAFPGR